MSQEKRDSAVLEKAKVTLSQSIMIGSAAGAVEVVVDHPLWVIKNRMQQGRSFTLNPAIVYRGILPNMASMVPITALQVGLDAGMQKIVFKEVTLSDTHRIATSFVAGIGSSLVSCPTEMIMMQQGKASSNFYTATHYLYSQGGLRRIYQGLLATSLREGGFTTFFLAGAPILKTKIIPYVHNEAMATLVSGVGAGIGATAVSQAFDTVKTVQQSVDILLKATQAAAQIYSSSGVYGFFKGCIPRGTRVVSALTIMGAVNESLNEHLSSINESSP